jgi:hypothetical protein
MKARKKPLVKFRDMSKELGPAMPKEVDESESDLDVEEDSDSDSDSDDDPIDENIYGPVLPSLDLDLDADMDLEAVELRDLLAVNDKHRPGSFLRASNAPLIDEEPDWDNI